MVALGPAKAGASKLDEVVIIREYGQEGDAKNDLKMISFHRRAFPCFLPI
jgi:hypothetical protein